MRGAIRGSMIVAAAGLFGLSRPAPSTAQVLDPDWCLTCRDTQLHAAGGALLDLGLHLPIAPKGFRDTVGKRLLVVAVIGFTYEVGQWDVAHSLGVAGQPGMGIGLKDFLADLAGAAATELLVALARWAAP